MKTLLRVVVTVVLLLIVLFLGYKSFGGRSYPIATVTAAELAGLRNQLELFKKEQGRYPTTAEGLQILANPPLDAQIAGHWHQYVPSIPVDQWGRPYKYHCPSLRHPESFDLYSLGPDGIASSDDIDAFHLP